MALIAGILAAAAAAPAVPPASAALGLPQQNGLRDAAGYACLTATGLAAPILAADGALVATVEVPWQKHGWDFDAILNILGNTTAPTPAAGFLALRATVPRERSQPVSVRLVARGTETVGATILLPGERARPSRLVLVARRAAGSLVFEAFRDGASLGPATYDSGAQAFSGLALAGAGLLVGCAGGENTAPLVPSASVATRMTGFDGAIGFVGYFDGPVSAADGAAISEGRAPQDVLPAAGWRFARVLADPAAAAHGPAPWAVADSLPAWTRTGPMRPGSDLVPAHDGSARLALDPVADGFVWAVGPGQATAPVALSGTAAGLAGGLEARFLYPDGTVIQDWRPLADADPAAGTWSGTVEAPLFAAGWGHAEVRAAARPALVQRSRALAGVGHAVGLIGQSNLQTVFIPALAPYQPARIGALSYVTLHPSAGGTAAPGSGAAVMDVVSAAKPFTEAFAAAAEEWAGYSGAPLQIKLLTQGGTAWQQLVDDDNPTRQWSDLTDMLAISGNRVGHLAIEWWATLAGPTTGQQLDALIEGTGPLWSAAYEHHLRDGTFATPFEVIVSPGTGFHLLDTADRGTDLALDQSGAPGTLVDVTNTEGTVHHRAWVAAKGAGHHLGVPKQDLHLTGGHAESGIAKMRGARRFVTDLAVALGLEPAGAAPVPVAVGSDGAAAIYVDVALPAGTTALRTEWDWLGETPPAGENPVQGLYVQEPGDANPRRSGFVAAITDDGSATGTARITLTRGTGVWAPGTEVSAFAGNILNLGTVTAARELWKGIPHATGNPRIEGGLGLMAWGVGGWHARRALPWTPAERFAGTGIAGEWWLVDDLGSVWADAGRTVPATVGGTVAVVAGQRGLHDIVWDGTLPTLRQDGGGRHYLETAATRGVVAPDGALDFPRATILVALHAQKSASGLDWAYGFPQSWPTNAAPWLRHGVAIGPTGDADFRHNGAASGNPAEPWKAADGSWPGVVLEFSYGATGGPTGFHELRGNGAGSTGNLAGDLAFPGGPVPLILMSEANVNGAVAGRFYGAQIMATNGLDAHQRRWDRRFWMEAMGLDTTRLAL